MTNQECPCKECILIPICRHREYYDLFEHCILVVNYIPNHRQRHIRNMIRIRRVFNMINPSKWYVSLEGSEVLQPRNKEMI